MNAIARIETAGAPNMNSESGFQVLDSRDLYSVSGGSISAGLAGVGFGASAGMASGAISGAIWGARVGGIVGAGVGALVGIGYVLATSGGGGGRRLRVFNDRR